jgi:hypothetical protein
MYIKVREALIYMTHKIPGELASRHITYNTHDNMAMCSLIILYSLSGKGKFRRNNALGNSILLVMRSPEKCFDR